MLTKNDLNQIRGVVSDEISGQLDAKLDSVKKDIKVLKGGLSKLQKNQDIMLDLLDKEQMEQRTRISRLEEHVEFSTPQ
jgi:predicted nuclease with TOPRIM domain